MKKGFLLGVFVLGLLTASFAGVQTAIGKPNGNG